MDNVLLLTIAPLAVVLSKFILCWLSQCQGDNKASKGHILKFDLPILLCKVMLVRSEAFKDQHTCQDSCLALQQVAVLILNDTLYGVQFFTLFFSTMQTYSCIVTSYLDVESISQSTSTSSFSSSVEKPSISLVLSMLDLTKNIFTE